MDDKEGTWDRRAYEIQRWDKFEKKLDDNTRLTMELRSIMAVHCEGEIKIKADLADVRLDVYGSDEGGKPGMKSELAELKSTQKWIARIAVFSWSFIIMIITTNAERIWKWIRNQ